MRKLADGLQFAAMLIGLAVIAFCFIVGLRPRKLKPGRDYDERGPY